MQLCGSSEHRSFFDLSLCFCFWNCTLLNPAKGAQSHFSSDLSEGSWTATTCSIPPEPFALYFTLMSLRWMSGLYRSTSSRTFLISSPSLSGSQTPKVSDYISFGPLASYPPWSIEGGGSACTTSSRRSISRELYPSG